MTTSCIGTNARTVSAYTLDRFHCMNIESHYCVQKKIVVRVCFSFSFWSFVRGCDLFLFISELKHEISKNERPRDPALGDDPERRGDFYICSFFLYDLEGFGSGHKLWRRWTPLWFARERTEVGRLGLYGASGQQMKVLEERNNFTLA